jgi:uncharacterized membrane protein
MGSWKKVSMWSIVAGAVAILMIALALRQLVQGLAKAWLQDWK